MNYNQIKALQKTYGFDIIQEMINNGLAWKMEGSVGREASALLDSGCCMLPKIVRFDYYGSRVPSRGMLEAGSKGTYKNSQVFWEGVLSGKIEIFEDSFEDMES